MKAWHLEMTSGTVAAIDRYKKLLCYDISRSLSALAGAQREYSCLTALRKF